MARAIGKSVGTGGFNVEADVKTVQDLLNLVPPGSGGPSSFLNVDGLAFGNTVTAINRFQRLALGMTAPDGRVDPNGRTLRKLQQFESNGSRQFTISRFELRNPTQVRTATSADRFYEVAAVGGKRRIIYFFSEGNDRLANASQVLPKLAGRAGEATTFSTQVVHSPLGFQVKVGMHSERADDANNTRTALSLPLSDQTLNILIRHRLINATTQSGVTSTIKGQFRPIGEFSGQS